MRKKPAAVLTVIVALVLLKMAFPDVSARLREALFPASDGETAYIDVFRTLGRRMSATEEAAPGPTTELSAPASEPFQFLSYRIEEGTAEGEQEVGTAEPLPEAVAAFLASQAAFSDYALPENVDYAYVSLPFTYRSPVVGCESSGFGYRLHPILNTVRFHYGTDLAANAGEGITAFADGVVSFVGSDDSYGKHLKLDHGQGWVSHYCHCSAIYVSAGQRVSKGELIALVGATGLATGPHLHFELSRDGVFVNPEYYINL